MWRIEERKAAGKSSSSSRCKGGRVRARQWAHLGLCAPHPVEERLLSIVHQQHGLACSTGSTMRRGISGGNPELATQASPWRPPPEYAHPATRGKNPPPICQPTRGEQPHFLQAVGGQAEAGVAVGQVRLVVLWQRQQTWLCLCVCVCVGERMHCRLRQPRRRGWQAAAKRGQARRPV